MAWRMSGTYVATCNCQLICPCPTDNPPTGPGGECRGAAAFAIADGNLDDVDLSGTAFALCNLFPSNLTSGNWKLGLVIDERASDAQADAIERVVRGDAGGMFAELSGLFGEWLGVERASISVSDGDSPTGTIGDVTFTFEPAAGPDGTPTTVKGAPFAFAPEYKIGRAPTRSSLFGLDFEGVYGESAAYEWTSEPVASAPKGRG